MAGRPPDKLRHEDGDIEEIMNIPMPNTLCVDQIRGNDATGAREDLSLPFATIQKARAAMQSGDTLLIGPGTYNLGTAVLPTFPAASHIIGAGAMQTVINKTCVGADPLKSVLPLGPNCFVADLSAN